MIGWRRQEEGMLVVSRRGEQEEDQVAGGVSSCEGVVGEVCFIIGFVGNDSISGWR